MTNTQKKINHYLWAFIIAASSVCGMIAVLMTSEESFSIWKHVVIPFASGLVIYYALFYKLNIWKHLFGISDNTSR